MQTVDPEQTQRSTVSDLGLYGLPRSPKMDARVIWVTYTIHKHAV